MKDLEKHSQLLKCLHESKDKAKHVLQLDSSYLAVKNKSGETVFHYLVIEKEKELAGFLLSLGANINTQCNSGDTPLSHSVLLNNLPMVKWLLANGAAIDLKDRNNETALSKSCHNEKAAIFETFLPHIKKININNYFSDLEADRIHSDQELVMRDALLEIGLRNPYSILYEDDDEDGDQSH